MMDRHYFMNLEEQAKKFGIVDKVVSERPNIKIKKVLFWNKGCSVYNILKL